MPDVMVLTGQKHVGEGECPFTATSFANTSDQGSSLSMVNRYLVFHAEPWSVFLESWMRSAESLVVYYRFTVFSNHSEGLHND